MGLDDRGLLVIPGAQKAGTSSLWRMLLQHESIHSLRPSKPMKEPMFFTLREEVVNRNLDWYMSLLGDEPGWYVDGSTGYLVSPEAPKLIESLPFPVKFLVVLREPAERSWSSYHTMHEKTPPADRRTFKEIVDFVWRHRDLGIEKAENEHIKRAIGEERLDPEYLQAHLRRLPVTSKENSLQDSLQDSLWCYKYLQGSLYSKWLTPFEESDSDALILSMEEMISDTEQTASRIFDYLGLERQAVELPHSNKSWHSPLWVRRARDFASKIVPGKGWFKMVRGVLPSDMAASGKQVKDNNRELLDKLKSLFEGERQYWSQCKPSVLKR